jgi:hypothetical protein
MQATHKLSLEILGSGVSSFQEHTYSVFDPPFLEKDQPLIKSGNGI